MAELAKIYARKYEVYVNGELVFETYNYRKAKSEKERHARMTNKVKLLADYEYLGIKELDKLRKMV